MCHPRLSLPGTWKCRVRWLLLQMVPQSSYHARVSRRASWQLVQENTCSTRHTCLSADCSKQASAGVQEGVPPSLSERYWHCNRFRTCAVLACIRSSGTARSGAIARAATRQDIATISNRSSCCVNRRRLRGRSYTHKQMQTRRLEGDPRFVIWAPFRADIVGSSEDIPAENADSAPRQTKIELRIHGWSPSLRGSDRESAGGG